MIDPSCYLERNVSSASTLAEPAADAHTLLGRRNRDGALAAPAQWNEVLDTILNHRSVRAFLPRALPAGTLELLVAAAQSASTSSNLQFWSVVAVQEPDRKSRLAELAGQQQFIRDAPLLLVWLADLSRLDRIAADQAQVDGTHYLEEFIVGVVDAALAAQSALIAAESLGLGGVYIGAMRNLPEQVAVELALPPHVPRCSACRSAIQIRHGQPTSSRVCHSRWCCTANSTPSRGAAMRSMTTTRRCAGSSASSG
jgi:nitroreductase